LKILVTGASGYLGSALARRLLAESHQVALLLRPGSSIARLGCDASQFEIWRCATEMEISACVKATQPEIVIHTACVYGRRGESLLQMYDANIRFGLTILQALLESLHPVTVFNSGTALSADVSVYSLTKNQFSLMGRQLATQSSGKLRFVNILLQHMLGPGDDPSKFTTSVIRALLANRPELRLTAGEQRRDLIYIDDVLDAYSVLVRFCMGFDAVTDIQLGSGVAPTIREFVEMAQRLTRSNTVLRFGALPYRHNESMYCCADLSIMKSFGWEPRYDLESALVKTIQLESPL
jgi:CDP-paratose synthetase